MWYTSKTQTLCSSESTNFFLLQFKCDTTNTIWCLGLWLLYILSASTDLPIAEKKLKVIYFRKKGDHCNDIFMRHSLLTIYELHIYELIKFVLKSINGLHQQSFCNNFNLNPTTGKLEVGFLTC